MKNQNFVGTGVALITPFNETRIDYEAYARLIEHVIQGGVDYLVPLGSTGEAATITEEEQKEILRFVVEKNAGRKPILAGCFGGNNTQAIMDKIGRFDFSGISGILSSSPEYSKPSQEGIYKHYAAVAECSPVPVMIYNVPGRTQSNITWETTVRLAEGSKNFIGIKEASGNLEQMTHIIQNMPDHFLVTSGDDPTAMAGLACGSDGVISVVANVFPGSFSEMIRAGLNNDFEKARRLNQQTFPLHYWLYKEGNPVGIKAAASLKGLCAEEVRLPLVKMSNEGISKMKEIMASIE